jgi:aspartyl-tRNA(Asn)/glutamyl-tRNA(Gln) amidotransferase subunit C
MSVTREDVIHVAQLARLELSPDEVQRFTEQLNTILTHVAELEAADVESIGFVHTPAAWPAPLRPDLPGADSLGAAPESLSRQWESGFFTVPRLSALDADAVEHGA